ncbi:Autophagy-Related Protein 9A [Manis pentadactyla]|nr:Autophagy-Related Protein 9A [Manis pentadactyla]
MGMTSLTSADLRGPTDGIQGWGTPPMRKGEVPPGRRGGTLDGEGFQKRGLEEGSRIWMMKTTDDTLVLKELVIQQSGKADIEQEAREWGCSSLELSPRNTFKVTYGDSLAARVESLLSLRPLCVFGADQPYLICSPLSPSCLHCLKPSQPQRASPLSS